METNTNTPEAKQPASAGCHPTTCSPSLIPLKDTRIETAGVMRCCLATVAEEYADPEHPGVYVGMKSCCRHCSEPFTLLAAKPHPKWVPDWIIRKENARAMPPATESNHGK
jgi:hypothetical protein